MKTYTRNHATFRENNCKIVGNHNIIIGHGCTVVGNHCVLIGKAGTLTGNHGKVEGPNWNVTGNHHKVYGHNCRVTGNHNQIEGDECTAEGTYNRINNPTSKSITPPSSLANARQGGNTFAFNGINIATNGSCVVNGRNIPWDNFNVVGGAFSVIGQTGGVCKRTISISDGDSGDTFNFWCTTEKSADFSCDEEGSDFSDSIASISSIISSDGDEDEDEDDDDDDVESGDKRKTNPLSSPHLTTSTTTTTTTESCDATSLGEQPSEETMSFALFKDCHNLNVSNNSVTLFDMTKTPPSADPALHQARKAKKAKKTRKRCPISKQ